MPVLRRNWRNIMADTKAWENIWKDETVNIKPAYPEPVVPMTDHMELITKLMEMQKRYIERLEAEIVELKKRGND